MQDKVRKNLYFYQEYPFLLRKGPVGQDFAKTISSDRK